MEQRPDGREGVRRHNTYVRKSIPGSGNSQGKMQSSEVGLCLVYWTHRQASIAALAKAEYRELES